MNKCVALKDMPNLYVSVNGETCTIRIGTKGEYCHEKNKTRIYLKEFATTLVYHTTHDFYSSWAEYESLTLLEKIIYGVYDGD